jgi:hypothetical protein
MGTAIMIDPRGPLMAHRAYHTTQSEVAVSRSRADLTASLTRLVRSR